VHVQGRRRWQRRLLRRCRGLQFFFFYSLFFTSRPAVICFVLSFVHITCLAWVS
jgi:hypothetical protein